MAAQKCYPSGGNPVLSIIGYALIVLGVILLFVCIPCWAWFALLGLVCIVVGVILLRVGRIWR